jgi:L-amino acid N-acyltransferase YncA
MQLRSMRDDDMPAVLRIHAEGIATGVATLETAPPSADEWDQTHLAPARLVACEGDEVVGWAALSAVSQRCVYEGVAEVSLYVAASARGRGVGRALLDGLVHAAEGAGFWTLEARILPTNDASLALHAACGFRTVGVRERIARLAGAWTDVLLLERRSDRF